MFFKSKWISVDRALPRDGQVVLIFDGNYVHSKPCVDVARFVRGRTAEQLAVDSCVGICDADEHGNNIKPYCWKALHGPMRWFGQDVTHWMLLPRAPRFVNSNYDRWQIAIRDYFNSLIDKMDGD